MKTYPILFSAPMVRALLDGSKTQTRRIVKPQPDHPHFYKRHMLATDDEGIDLYLHSATMHKAIRCPYGKPSDQLWVREKWRIGAWDDADGKIAIDYADGPCKEWVAVPEDPDAYHAESVFEHYWIQSTDDCINAGLSPNADDKYKWEPGQSPCRWRPSIHMPRWASRITLEITSVRVERLQDISEGDAIAEGCTKNHNGYYWGGPHAVSGLKQLATAKSAYRDLWESINGPGSWDANPWVWAISFKVIKP